MDPGGEDWSAVLGRLEAGDRTAFLRFQRLVTGFLLELRAFDFEDEWDDLRQEVLAAVIANARAGRLRDPQAFAGYVRIITRNKFFDRLKRRRVTGVYVEGLSYEEMSERAGVPLGTLKRRLREGLAALRVRLGEGTGG